MIKLNIGKKIYDRRIALGMSQAELAQRAGYKSRSSINKIELGINDVPQSKIKLFADILDCSVSYLMDYDDKSFDAFNILPLPEVRSIPIIGTIACGDPINATENVDGYVSVPTTIDADFALRCKGDSMVGARILDGDIVFIRQQPDVENGEIAAVLIDGEATLKRVHKQNGSLVLYPENSAYAPIVLVGAELENVRILGKAVSFISNVR